MTRQGEVTFEDFTLERIDVGEAELRVRHGGSGPAVLLLHGHPRTHVTWHRVAPILARSIDCGHHIAEEAPEELAAELVAFFGWRRQARLSAG